MERVVALDWVSYYKAPPTANISPTPIREGVEYIELLLKGSVMFDDGIDDKERKCGSLFWHVEGDETIYRNIPAHPYECMVFVFAVRPGSERIAPHFSFWPNPQQVRDFAWEIFRAFQAGVTSRQLMKEYVYNALRWQAIKSNESGQKSALPEVLPQLLEYIEIHLADDLQVPDLIRVGKISAPYLHKLFRKHFHTTPHQYILLRKLKHACELLTNTSYQVKMICSECGIKNVETFSRAFRRAYGMTPIEFRQSKNTRSAE